MKKRFLISSLLLMFPLVSCSNISLKSYYSYVDKEIVITELFSNISVNVLTADLEFKVSDSNEARVVLHEKEKQYHDIEVINDTLNIANHDTRLWYERIIPAFEKMSVIIYLPFNSYGDVNINGSTGNIIIPDSFTFSNLNARLSTGDISLSADIENDCNIESTTGNVLINDVNSDNMNLELTTGKINIDNTKISKKLNISLSTGKVNISNSTSGNLKHDGTTGSVKLTNMLVKDHIDINTSTGDITLDYCDASSLKLKTTTGDVKGSLLTNKIFKVKTTTGRIKVPESSTGGLCEVETTTGQIIFTIEN